MNLKENLIQIVRETASAEDRQLYHLAKKGIFFMPEIAFAYQVGKSLMNKSIAMENKIEWIRENKISENYGIADMVIKNGTENYVIEFKMADKFENYKKDILKLQNLGASYTKIFCALIDAFSDQLEKDDRIIRIDALRNIKRITEGDFYGFKTNYSHFGYKAEIYCMVCVWEVC